jgi:hypothetical protein
MFDYFDKIISIIIILFLWVIDSIVRAIAIALTSSGMPFDFQRKGSEASHYQAQGRIGRVWRVCLSFVLLLVAILNHQLKCNVYMNNKSMLYEYTNISEDWNNRKMVER